MYSAKDFSHLLGLEGMSDALLNNHFTLYQGYVTNTNKMAESIGMMSKDGKATTPECGELRRRFGWEFNGMRLHELYFGNMSKEKKALDTSSPLAQSIAGEFGSLEMWEQDFKAAGAMRGIGWVILYQDRESGKLTNCWINEHDLGHLAGAKPLLVMDVFEHAFMLDYGLKRADYINAFWNAIDWIEVEARFAA